MAYVTRAARHFAVITSRSKPCVPRRLVCRPCKLHTLRVNSTAPSDVDEGMYRDAEQSARLIDQMVQQIARTSLVEAASDYVVGEEHQGTAVRRRAIRSLVESRLEEMNDTFLPTLIAYLEAMGAGVADDPKLETLITLIEDIREEVLAQLTQRLPPPMQLMNTLLTAPGSEARNALLAHHTTEGGPLHVDAPTLQQMVLSMIHEMEGMAQVPDSRLLARLCLLKEEVVQLQQERAAGFAPPSVSGRSSDTSEAGAMPSPESTQRMQALLAKMEKPESPLNQGLPAHTMGFIKNLMAVGDPDTRRALLTDAFKQGMGADLSPQEASERALQDPADRGEVFLPGQFMDCLTIVQRELLGEVEAGRVAVEEAVLVRLEDVRRDGLAVLVDLSGEDAAGYSP